MRLYQNPVLAGFHPDPSICRVGADFYLVTSTFEFFPGVPIYHSRNLVNWEAVGHCLTTPEQLPLRGCRSSGGIYAPTIRYHGGRFYMTTTNVTGLGNFIVHTNDIGGEWSKPFPVDQSGIDPSLFFDGDGTVYYTSTGHDKDGRQGIQMSIVNPVTGERLCPARIISHGDGGCYPEAPHIYKRGEYYYLMIAEGGTEYGHRVTIHRAKSPWGPYDRCPRNPIVSNQNRMGLCPVQAVGHADMLEDQNGNWWLVCLGIRPLPGRLLHNLGRETFLAPVTWDEDGWPIVGQDGIILPEMSGPLPGESFARSDDFVDFFDGNSLRPQWNYIRNPDPGCCSLTNRPGCVTLRGDTGLSEPGGSPAFIGVRQASHQMEASATLTGPLEEGQQAGLAVYYSDSYHYEIYLENHGEQYYVGVFRRVHDLECEVYSAAIDYDGELTLTVTADTLHYRFSYGTGGERTEAAKGSVAGLCTEGTETMTFTGTYIGIYSVGGAAAFSCFRMKSIQ